MKVSRYSRWDGSQAEFSLDADAALDALSDLMMQGLTASEAMEYMQNFGFDLAGQNFRVMGTQELMEELRKKANELVDQHNLDEATDELQERFEEMARLEEAALREQHGFESRAMNEFLQRRHSDAKQLADKIEQFEDYDFESDEASEIYEELKQEKDRLKALEEFLERASQHFRGMESADYEQAQDIREQLEGLQQSMQALSRGDLDGVNPQTLNDLLGEDAGRSMILLQDLDGRMRQEGYLRNRDGEDELTPKAVRRIGAQALASVYESLRKSREGGHATNARGVSLPRPDESRPYEFGDPLEVDVVKSVMNSLRRRPGGVTPSPGSTGRPGGTGLQMSVDDLEVREKDFTTQTTTVLLLDLSWSMSFEDRFPAAKRVALAMDQLIRTQYPRDHFFIVGFSTRARELRIAELPEVSWDPGDPFTNLQDGLQVAERLIVQHPSPTPQILVITDGQPTAYYTDDGELHVEWPSGRGGISPTAVAQTLKQVRRVTQRGITINTFMLHDSPELVGFVERLTEINRGRALFTDPAHLGSYMMVDHFKRRHRGRR